MMEPATHPLAWVRTQMPRKPNGHPDAHAKLILVLVCIYHNRSKGYAWPSQSELVLQSGLGESSVAKALANLERGDYIRRQPHFHDRGPRKGQRTGDNIFVNFRRSADSLERCVPQPEGLARAARNRGGEVGRL